MSRLLSIAVAASLFSITAPARAVDARTTASGVFTEEQAKSGEKAYQASCAACHGLDLHKVDPEAPDLIESNFRYAWHGKPLRERFEKTRDTMPKGDPRSLSDEIYLDIVAYLLRANGVAAGPTPLTRADLEQITVELPAPAAGGGARRRR